VLRLIQGGIFSLPSHLSDETRHLLTRMLVVDPVKRATIAEIRANPWFQENLPHYLQPLPPTPSLQTPNVPVGELRGLLGAQPGAEGAELDESQQKLAEARGLIYTHDLGIVDPEIVDELCEKMAGFDRSDVWDALKKEGDNQIKVAYQLVRDHKRMLEDCKLAAVCRYVAEIMLC
jgi:carbon catabolite-derepressing protein kinase